MIADHSGLSRWICFACASSEQHPSFDDQTDFIAHLNEQHAKGIKSQQIPLLVSAWLRKSPALTRSCPLCSYFHEDADVILSHTAEHIHSFSLMSLPWASTEEKDPDVHGDYFKHHKYFSMDQSTHGSMQASSSAGSQAIDSDLPALDFEPAIESNHLTKDKLEHLNENSDLKLDLANWLESIKNENEGLVSSKVTWKNTTQRLRRRRGPKRYIPRAPEIHACFRCIAIREKVSHEA